MTTETEPRANVLVVDDTVENLRLLSGILGDRGYDVRPVTNGADALEAAKLDPPDLVLLDVTMPGMNGFEVCTALKADATTRDVPVIFLTALTDVKDKVAGFSAGGVDFITKPFHVQEVLARVATQVALKRSREALADSLARLQGLERLRDDLVKMVVHDMRGLLTVVMANLEIARPEISGQPAEDLDDAINAAKAVCDMANTLLDVSRLEEQKMPLALAPANVVDIAAASRDAMINVDTTRRLHVIAPGAVEVSCDAGLVRRVVDNLVSNAIKHTPSGGTITIRVTALVSSVRVSIEDEGAGVPVELRGRIFEKFAGAATKDAKAHSAGLGLAFCKLAIEAHGGTIRVEPREPRGSVFVFDLPA